MMQYRLLLLWGAAACAQDQSVRVRQGESCPIVNPGELNPSPLWNSANVDACAAVTLTIWGEDILEDSYWITDDPAAAQGAVVVPDLSGGTISSHEALEIEVCPTDTPLQGVLHFEFESGCVASLYISQED